LAGDYVANPLKMEEYPNPSAEESREWSDGVVE